MYRMNEQAHEAYTAFLTLERGLAPETIKGYAYRINEFETWAREHGTKDWREVGWRTVERYLTELSGRGLKPATRNIALSSLRSYGRFLVMEGVIKTNPAKHIPNAKRSTKIPDILTVDEVFRLIVAPMHADCRYPLRDGAILSFAYSTAARCREIINLRLEDLRLHDQLALLRGKGSKERLVPFDKNTRERMKRYIEHERGKLIPKGEETTTETVFLSSRKRPLSRMGMYKLVKKWVGTVGINKHITPHTLRHTCAVHLLENGADLRLIQALLGHAKLSTTEQYLRAATVDMREIARLHPRNYMDVRLGTFNPPEGYGRKQAEGEIYGQS